MHVARKISLVLLQKFAFTIEDGKGGQGSFEINLQQVANLLCAQVNTASYPTISVMGNE